MNIPSKIKIGGYTYNVSLVENISRDKKSSAQSCMNGQWIHIDSSIFREQQESALIHEVIEQIDCINQLGLEHRQICVIESMLYQVIRDNAGIFHNESELEDLYEEKRPDGTWPDGVWKDGKQVFSRSE